MSKVKLRCSCGDLLGHFEVAGGVLALAHNQRVRDKADTLAVESIKLGYSNALADAVIARGNEPLTDSELAESIASPTDRQILAKYYSSPFLVLSEHDHLLLSCTCRLTEHSARLNDTLWCIPASQLKQLWATAHTANTDVVVADLDRFDPEPMIEALRYGKTPPAELDPWDQWIADSQHAKRKLYRDEADEWPDEKLGRFYQRYRQEAEALPMGSKERADKAALADELKWRLESRAIERSKQRETTG